MISQSRSGKVCRSNWKICSGNSLRRAIEYLRVKYEKFSVQIALLSTGSGLSVLEEDTDIEESNLVTACVDEKFCIQTERGNETSIRIVDVL